MQFKFLDNITGFGDKDWSKQWIIAWFVVGVIALFVGFWQTTEHTGLDWFYLIVSYIGLLCVVGLSFRKNVMGNGFGMLATAGEVVVQGSRGAIGLMLAPLFNFFTHVWGVIYWKKNTDADGNMLPQSANKYVWIITVLLSALAFIYFQLSMIGLLLIITPFIKMTVLPLWGLAFIPLIFWHLFCPLPPKPR